MAEPDHDDAGFQPFEHRDLVAVTQTVDVLHRDGCEHVDFI
jgi:hypothetical protein